MTGNAVAAPAGDWDPQIHQTTTGTGTGGWPLTVGEWWRPLGCQPYVAPNPVVIYERPCMNDLRTPDPELTEAHDFLTRLGAPGKQGKARLRERLAAYLATVGVEPGEVEAAQFGD